MINQNICVVKDASDASGFKIPAEMVLEPDPSPLEASANQRRLRSLKKSMGSKFLQDIYLE